jgi:Ca2+-binding EF-hand superfamily protein
MKEDIVTICKMRQICGEKEREFRGFWKEFERNTDGVIGIARVPII